MEEIKQEITQPTDENVNVETKTDKVSDTETNADAVKTEEKKTDNKPVVEDETELFTKLDEILEKRSNSIVKSILRDNDVEDNEVGEILTRYKAYKKSSKTKDAENLSRLQAENDELSKKLFSIELDSAAAKVADEIGLNRDKLSYAMKLADTTKAINGKTINTDELKASLVKVLEDIPEFKKPDTTSTNNNPVRKVGVEKKVQEPIDKTEMLRKAMGIKSK